MKKFLSTFLLFIGILFVYLVFTGLVNYCIYSSTNVDLKKSSILIIGDSHSQTSLDPNYFTSAQNISQSKEPYILTYWKLKEIVKLWKPDTVMVGFSPHNISAFNDLKFSDDKWSNEIFRRCYAIEDINSIRGDIKVDFYAFYKVLFRQLCLFPKSNHFNFIGSYRKHDRSDISDFGTVIERHYFFNNKELGTSNVSISYLDSIISLCKLNKITTILISSPVHKLYFERIPSSILLKFQEVRNRLYSNGIIIIDKTNDYYSDFEYYNSDYLNTMGASRFSNEIKGILSKRGD